MKLKLPISLLIEKTKLSLLKKSEIKDLNFNKLILKDFFVSLENDYIRSDEGKIIDKEQNEFEIKNIFYNFQEKKF